LAAKHYATNLSASLQRYELPKGYPFQQNEQRVSNSIKTEELLPYLVRGGGLFGAGWDTAKEPFCATDSGYAFGARNAELGFGQRI